MKLKEFGFKNICNYGNNIQKITLSEDKSELILISGENGKGKTTIYNSLIFSLYGKSSKRRIKDLPNRWNKALHVYNEFVTKDGRSVEIHRGLAPGFFDLKINGQPENPSGKAEIDALVENQLIGIPFEVAVNTMMLSINDFKSFAKMKKDDKRKIVNKIFPIERIDKMHEILKEDVKVAKDKHGKLEYAVDINEQTLKTVKEEYDRLKNEAEKYDEQERKRIEEEIKDLKENLQKEEEKLEASIERINELNKLKEETRNAIEKEYAAKIDKLNSEKKSLNESLSKFKEEVKSQHKSDMQSEWNDIEREDREQKEQVDKKNDEVKAVLDKEFENKKANVKKEYDDKIKQIKNEHENKTSKLENELQSSKLKSNELNEKIEVIKQEKNDLTSEIKDLNRRLELHKKGYCHKCGTDLSDKKQNGFNDISINLNEKNKTLQYKKSQIEELNENKEAVDNKIEELNKAIYEVNNSKIKKENAIETEKNSRELEASEAYRSVTAKADEIKNEKYNKITSDTNDKKMHLKEKYTNIIHEKTQNKTQEINEKLFKIDEDVINVNKEKHVEVNDKIEVLNNELSEQDKSSYRHGLKIEELNLNLKNKNTELGEIDKNSLKKKEVDLKKKQLDGERLKLDELNFNKMQLESEMEKYARTQELFMDDGLKRLVMSKFLPVFNNKIEELIRKLEYKFAFYFDEDFNPVISHLGEEISVESLSSGEEKMLDIIVILAMVELIKYRNPDINVMFLDEIYNTLDLNNIKKVTQILREYADEYGITIFIISHTPVPMEYFDKHISVEINENFSELNVN